MSKYWWVFLIAGVAWLIMSLIVFRMELSTVYAISSYSDWLYWHQPDLRGRLAYDIRFEIYRRPTIQATADFVSMRGPDWAKQSDGYDVVVVDRPRDDRMVRGLAPRGRVVTFSLPTISVLTRRPEP